MPLDRTYPVTIVRAFPPGELAALPAAEADRGEEDGLAGNRDYQDIRGVSWDDLDRTLQLEGELLRRFAAAEDKDLEAELFEEERLEAVLPEEELWGLDVGVAGAVLALAALGAVPVVSCNAGGFGGHHVAQFPYVGFFLGHVEAQAVLTAAEEADVGLDIVAGGLGRLFGRTDLDLHRFARRVLARHKVTQVAR